MDSIRIVIKQEPVAKGRPRTSYRNGVVRTYTPQKTQDAQEYIRAKLLKHRDKMFGEHVPVRLVITFYRTKSKWLKKSETIPVRKPDVNNFLSLALDSMSGNLFCDDAQVSQVLMKKRWTNREYGYITMKLTRDVLSKSEDN